MTGRRVARFASIPLTILFFSALIGAFATTNSVAGSKADLSTRPITANSLKPAFCNALNLTAIVVGQISIDATGANELILGSALPDAIRGRQGDDCILAGGGADNLRGDQDTDVCIGGPGIDTFHPSCETQIQ